MYYFLALVTALISALGLLIVEVSSSTSCTPLSLGCTCQTKYVSAADLAAASTTIRNAIISQSPADPSLNRGDVVGLLVRLAFHDSAEYDRQQTVDVYRADGCIDATEDDNKGLQEGIDLLQPLWLQHCSVFSRADFWYLAALVSINKAEPSGTYNIPFNYGRIDAATCTGTAGRLPSSEGGFGELTRVFVNQMGMTTRQAVAVIGAHTLGRAVTANSGYSGSWVPQTATFDNVFFRDILGVGWRKTAIDDTHHQWNGPPNTNTIMLNTDMSLGFAGSDGLPNNRLCGGTQPPPPGQTACARAANIVDTGITSFELIQQYGSNNALFLSDFSSSFVAMMSVGYGSSLITYSPSMVAPTNAPTADPTYSMAPTFAPTTAAPTQSMKPTETPTEAPTFVPTTATPLSDPSSSKGSDTTPLSSVAVGLIAGGASLIAVMGFSYFVYVKVYQDKIDYNSVSPNKSPDFDVVDAPNPSKNIEMASTRRA